MHEYLLHPLLHLIFCPVGMLLAETRCFELSGSPIHLKRRAQPLSSRHAAQRGEVFRREVGGHALRRSLRSKMWLSCFTR